MSRSAHTPTRSATLTLSLGLLAGSAAQAARLQFTVLARDGQQLVDAVAILETVASTGRPKAPPPADEVISQQKMQFVPALTVVPAGSRVMFSNLDRWEHHVRGLPAGLAGLTADPQSGLELRLNGKAKGKPADSATITVDQARSMQLGCHLHGLMRGSLYVPDTPWAVKTDGNGVGSLVDLREGAARLTVWHADQLLDATPTPLTITPVTALRVETRVNPRRRRS
jgi:plastocyanin